MERTDMATPEKTNDKFSTTNSQPPPKTKPTRCYPPGDALALTLAFPCLRAVKTGSMRGQCAAKRAKARFELFCAFCELAPICTKLHQIAPNCSMFLNSIPQKRTQRRAAPSVSSVSSCGFRPVPVCVVHFWFWLCQVRISHFEL